MQNMQVFVSVQVTGLFLNVISWVDRKHMVFRKSVYCLYTHGGVCVCVCGNDFLSAADVWVPVRTVLCFVQVARPQPVLE